MMIILLLCLSPAFAMIAWPPITSDDGHLDLPKPQSWSEKHLGQWCRNFTIHKHIQCPEASAFTEYVCCGEHNVECCFHLQKWVYLIIILSGISLGFNFIFYLLLKFHLICTDGANPPKMNNLR